MGAVVLGEAAVVANLVSAPPMIIVVGITGIAGFATPPMLHGPTILIRFTFVLLASILGVIRLSIRFGGLADSFGHYSFLRRPPYLTGYTSLRPQEAKDTAFAPPWWWMLLRPKFLGSRNRVRLRGGNRL